MTIDLTEALVKKGHDVTVLVGFNNNQDHVAINLMKRLNTTRANIRTFFAPNKSSKVQLFRGAVSLIYNIFRFGRNGVLHVQSPYLSWAPWLLRQKFVSTLHVADLVKCLYYKNASHLIAISNETKEYAMQVFGYRESDITIVNHGVSPDFSVQLTREQISQARKQLNLPIDKLILTIVGSIEPRKGQDILLKAIAELPKDCQDKVHIVFLGSDKTIDKHNSQWIERAISETGTAGLVSHFEYMDSKLFYRISDIFVLPSWIEGFPLVVIEAMLSGDLCIRTDAEGAYEQIIDGQTGFIFPKGDFIKLAKILEKVISDDDLRQSIADNGRNYALTHFVSEVMAEKTISVYNKIEQ